MAHEEGPSGFLYLDSSQGLIISPPYIFFLCSILSKEEKGIHSGQMNFTKASALYGYSPYVDTKRT